GVPALSVTNTFQVIVNEVNLAPVLTVPANQTINEQTALNVSASATDADLPANSLTFALVSAPTGMTINPATGAISWTPTEGQGPSTNAVSVSVTDNGVPRSEERRVGKESGNGGDQADEQTMTARHASKERTARNTQGSS